MAARVNFYAEDATESSYSASANVYQEKLTLTFTPDAGKSYVYLMSCLLQSSGSGVNVMARLRHVTAGTTPIDVLLRTKDSTDYYSIYGMAKEDFGASPPEQNLKIEYATAQTLNVARIKRASIVAVELGANDQYAESLAVSSDTSSTNYNAKTTLSWTAGANEDWLIVATAEYTNDATNQQTKLRLSDGTNAFGEGQRRPIVAGQYMPWGTVVKTTLTGAQTWTLEYGRVNASGGASIRNARIVAFRAADFEALQYAESRPRSTTTSATEQDKVSLGFTPIATDHLILGCWQVDNATGTTNSTGSMLDEDGSNVFDALNELSSTADEIPCLAAYRSTLTGAPKTWKIQWTAEGGTAAGILEAALAVIQLGAAAGDITVGSTGVAATGEFGGPSVRIDAADLAAGGEATLSVGTTQSLVSVAGSPAGVGATTGLGDTVIFHDGAAATVGTQGAGRAGLATPVYGASVEPGGLAAPAQAGSVILAAGSVAAPPGSEASVLPGAASATVSAAVMPGAAAASAQIGLISVPSEGAVGVSGCVASAETGPGSVSVGVTLSLVASALAVAIGAIRTRSTGWSAGSLPANDWSGLPELAGSWLPITAAARNWNAIGARTARWTPGQQAGGGWTQ